MSYKCDIDGFDKQGPLEFRANLKSLLRSSELILSGYLSTGYRLNSDKRWGGIMAVKDLLKSVYLFKDFSLDELALIAGIAKELNFMAGQDIFVRGMKAESFYLIRVGSVKIFSVNDRGDETDIATIQSGSHFGEMAFLDGSDRSATAQTIEATSIFEIPYKQLKSLLDNNATLSSHFYRSLASFLAARLRNTTNDYRHLKELHLKHF